VLLEVPSSTIASLLLLLVSFLKRSAVKVPSRPVKVHGKLLVVGGDTSATVAPSLLSGALAAVGAAVVAMAKSAAVVSMQENIEESKTMGGGGGEHKK